MKLLKMFSLLLPVLLTSMSSIAAPAPPVELKRGMKITTSVQVKAAVYQLNGYDSLGRPVILIEGNNITVDFNKAIMQGSNKRRWQQES
ncbi:MAG TPA: hypothetical protein VK489_07795 [Ferruginibacter sp.]|nr:hypothetical protein [Ferruginibacter sp.]